MFPDYRTEDRTRFIEIMWYQLVAISCLALTPNFENLSLTKYLRFSQGVIVKFHLIYIITNYLCMTNLFFYRATVGESAASCLFIKRGINQLRPANLSWILGLNVTLKFDKSFSNLWRRSGMVLRDGIIHYFLYQYILQFL